jgi:hypothetical protein
MYHICPDNPLLTMLYTSQSRRLRAPSTANIQAAHSDILAAHSRFRIPINVHDDSICNVTLNSNLGQLLR